ncbi:MAG: hypothetical protein ABSC61_04670 [Anaerolineales bacterium]
MNLWLRLFMATHLLVYRLTHGLLGSRMAGQSVLFAYHRPQIGQKPDHSNQLLSGRGTVCGRRIELGAQQ